MPELPEVETIRRQLAPLVQGLRLQEVEVLDPRWSRPLTPAELQAALCGRRVDHLGRRGKYLLWELSDEVFLAQHLRMTGTVLVDPDPEPPHTRVRLLLAADAGVGERRRLVLVDPRRFGTGELLLGREAMERFFGARLGLEPLHADFTAQHLRAIARGRKAPIKAFLLDQRRVAGVGNIYADEALHRAGIHPLRPAGALSARQHARLRDAVVQALQAGIDANGATIDDFRHVDGVTGSFQDQFLVHLRAGQPCPACGTPVVKIVAAGRGTYVCERCQPVPRRRHAARETGPRTGGRSSPRGGGRSTTPTGGSTPPAGRRSTSTAPAGHPAVSTTT
jgi:formamidopyrimidine-DNA glycosylase